MPKTVSDAFIVCKNLNMRFLWVDRLCITQDCDLDKKAQLSYMGYIYGGAQLTIVAGYGDNANSGLPGVSDISRKREQCSTQFGNLKLTTMPRDAFQALLDSPWYSRGWTFQELLLSKRLLAFTEEQMLFLCVKSSFREDLVLEARNGSIFGQSLMPSLPPHISLTGHMFDLDDINRNIMWRQQGIKSYETFLADYLRRTLGNDGDILNAFSAILETLFPYVGPFRWGLPVFCSSLIFQWYSNDRFPLPRRNGVPSWSWAGWKDYTKHVSFGQAALGDSPFRPNAALELEIFVFTDQGQLTPMTKSTYLHEGPHDIEDMDPEVLSQLKKPYNQYLVFWADCGYLHVDRQPLETTSDVYAIRSRQMLFEVGCISLDPNWRANQDDFLEFVLFMNDNRYRFMLITRNGPVASRVQLSKNDLYGIFFGRSDFRNQRVILD
jgi:hypothetical protein